VSEAEHWEWAEVVEPSDYGRARREAWLADQQAKAKTMMDMLSGGAQDQHRADHDAVTSGQHGIFGMADSPYELGAAVAARAATVGGEWGHAQAIERHGAPTHHLEGPALPQADRRPRGQTGPDPDARSPVMRWQRGEQ
jgi:hypothetical protein